MVWHIVKIYRTLSPLQNVTMPFDLILTIYSTSLYKTFINRRHISSGPKTISITAKYKQKFKKITPVL